MPPRIWTLSAGGVAIVGAAVAGGYFLGHSGHQLPLVQTTQAPAEQPAQPYPQEGEQSSASEQAQSNYPPGYERSVYSPWKNGSYQRAARHRSRRVSFQYFRDELSPHGQWMHSDRWGEVWQPTEVQSDFHPYERGHWANTQEFGWTWVSDYEWGAIPFHYGRWVDDPERGWLWVPGYVWGPGWVVWRTGSHHTGWMPMPPDQHFLRGEENERVDWSRESDDYGYRDWYGSYYDQDRLDSHWIYVDTGHFADPDYRRYEVRRPDEIRQLSIETHNVTNYVTVDNFVVNRSVDPRMVEEQSGRRIESVPAMRVLARPELVVPVNAGTQIAIATHENIPAGTGKPHSAPAANPVALNAPLPPANAPLPPLPPNAPTSVLATQGPNGPIKPTEQKPNASASTNAGAVKAAAGRPPASPPANAALPQQQAQQPATQPNGALFEKHHRVFAPALPQQEGGPQPPANTTNAPNGAPSPTANALPTPQQTAAQPSVPNEERKHHRGVPALAQQQVQPQAPAKPSAPSTPPPAAAPQPPTSQEQAQQSNAPTNARTEKHRHGAPLWAQPGATQQAGPSASTNATPPTAAKEATPPQQQAQQSQPSGNDSAPSGGEARSARRAHQVTPPSGEQNGGASQPSGAAGVARQPPTPQDQEAKHHEKKGEVVPSSLPPGSPSPYAKTQNAPPSANGEGESQDQSNAEQKHKKHREKNETPDTGESPQQQ